MLAANADISTVTPGTIVHAIRDDTTYTHEARVICYEAGVKDKRGRLHNRVHVEYTTPL